MRLWAAIVALAASVLGGQSLSELSTIPTPLRKGDTLIVGFLGAWEQWDDENRSVRKLALKLRSQGFRVETLSNRKRGVALKLIRRALDANRDGRLNDKERSSVRIVLFGQSLGGLAVVKLARELEQMNVPVLLTVQIDSIGLTDVTIPPNVAQAANLHQQSRFSLRGQDVIRAADPNRTTIIENKEFTYSVFDPSDRPETWARRRLGGGHAQMEADPAVWAHVEDLILDALKGIK